MGKRASRPGSSWSHPARQLTNNRSQARQDRDAGSDRAGLARSRRDVQVSARPRLRRVDDDGDLVIFGSTLKRIETRRVREIFLSVSRAAFFLAPDQRPNRHADQHQRHHDHEAWSCHRSHFSLLAVGRSAGVRGTTKVHECRIGYSSRADSNAVADCVLTSRGSMTLPHEPHTRASVLMCSLNVTTNATTAARTQPATSRRHPVLDAATPGLLADG